MIKKLNRTKKKEEKYEIYNDILKKIIIIQIDTIVPNPRGSKFKKHPTAIA